MRPAEMPPADDASAAAVSNDTTEAQAQDVFVNPLSAAAASPAPEANSEAAPREPPVSRVAAQPHAAVAEASAAAQQAAQPPLDDDADVSEAHALLPQHHARAEAHASADASTMAHHESAVQGRGQGDSDGDSVSLDSPAAGRPPEGSDATMANPYWQIHGAMRNPLAEQAPDDTPSSRGHKVLWMLANCTMICTMSHPACMQRPSSTVSNILVVTWNAMLSPAAAAGWARGAASAGAPHAAGDHTQPAASQGAAGPASVAGCREPPARWIVHPVLQQLRSGIVAVHTGCNTHFLSGSALPGAICCGKDLNQVSRCNRRRQSQRGGGDAEGQPPPADTVSHADDAVLPGTHAQLQQCLQSPVQSFRHLDQPAVCRKLC